MSLSSANKNPESPFIELQSVDSTNKYAVKLVHEGLAQPGMIIFTHDQTSGKGQRSKKWASEKGKNITISIIIRPGMVNIPDLFAVNACVAVAAHRFFSKYAGDDTKIKWPNDIYWRDRKAGGILIENSIKAGRTGSNSWEWSVAGIGININQTGFDPDIPNPVSLKQITGKDYDPLTLAKELANCVDNQYKELAAHGQEKTFEEYNRQLYKKNETVKLKKDNRVFEATIKEVNQYGQLTVLHSIAESFDFGSIEWLV